MTINYYYELEERKKNCSALTQTWQVQDEEKKQKDFIIQENDIKCDIDGGLNVGKLVCWSYSKTWPFATFACIPFIALTSVLAFSLARLSNDVSRLFPSIQYTFFSSLLFSLKIDWFCIHITLCRWCMYNV